MLSFRVWIVDPNAAFEIRTLVIYKLFTQTRSEPAYLNMCVKFVYLRDVNHSVSTRYFTDMLFAPL